MSERGVFGPSWERRNNLTLSAISQWIHREKVKTRNGVRWGDLRFYRELLLTVTKWWTNNKSFVSYYYLFSNFSIYIVLFITYLVIWLLEFCNGRKNSPLLQTDHWSLSWFMWELYCADISTVLLIISRRTLYKGDRINWFCTDISTIVHVLSQSALCMGDQII